ncbi:MAG: transposase [Chloroflexi bacterium]|nr:transposase [Chloroflexota bacterium]MCL5108375.1 transposase [Chloroflexota bacterium]
MQGKKVSQSKLFFRFSLEDAVPADDFYRELEKAVDLSWIGPKVAHCYSDIGRPSIDPEVIVKIELIGYLEGITSERALMRQIADRLSPRRYIGYDIDEAVPDHSTLSKARDLLGRDLFQEVFAYSVRLCQAAGMVGGLRVSGDRTLVKANASLDSLEPRLVPYSPQGFLERLYAQNPAPGPEPAPVIALSEQPDYPTLLPVAADTALPPISPATPPTPVDFASGQVGDAGSSPATAKPLLGNATHVSASDPEATLVARPDVKPMLAYSAEPWSDARAGVITHADAFTAATPEHTTATRALIQQRGEFGLALATMAYDKGCGQGRLYRQWREFGIVAFVPHQKYVNSTSGPGLYELKDFAYDAQRNVYVCPGGKELKYSCLKARWPTAGHVWQAKPSDREACASRAKCTKASRYRNLKVGIYQPYYETMDARLAGPGARLAAIARRAGPEAKFAEGKQWQGLDRAKYRGPHKFKGQVLLTAAAQNIKKYVKWIWRKTKGAGHARTIAPALLLAAIRRLRQTLTARTIRL